jgi:N-acylneuraminate cytidylyltransferase
MRVLGIIPARGGSKGIPHKNRRELSGKPLLYYTIEAALQAKKLDRVIFSSDDERLISLARRAGVEVPFVRPSHLAQVDSGSLAVVQHAVQYLEEQGHQYDAVCLLQVTNPFRTATDIDSAISKFQDEHTDSLISVVPVPHEFNPHWVFEPTIRGTLKLATGDKEIIQRRQELPKAYIRDGAIYLTKTEVLFQKNSFYGSTIGYVISDAERHVNIDTEADWQRAEMLAKKLKV